MGLPIASTSSPSLELLDSVKRLQQRFVAFNYRENPDLLAFARAVDQFIRSPWAVQTTRNPAIKRKRYVDDDDGEYSDSEQDRSSEDEESDQADDDTNTVLHLDDDLDESSSSSDSEWLSMPRRSSITFGAHRRVPPGPEHSTTSSIARGINYNPSASTRRRRFTRRRYGMTSSTYNDIVSNSLNATSTSTSSVPPQPFFGTASNTPDISATEYVFAQPTHQLSLSTGLVFSPEDEEMREALRQHLQSLWSSNPPNTNPSNQPSGSVIALPSSSLTSSISSASTVNGSQLLFSAVVSHSSDAATSSSNPSATIPTPPDSLTSSSSSSSSSVPSLNASLPQSSSSTPPSYSSSSNIQNSIRNNSVISNRDLLNEALSNLSRIDERLAALEAPVNAVVAGMRGAGLGSLNADGEAAEEGDQQQHQQQQQPQQEQEQEHEEPWQPWHAFRQDDSDEEDESDGIDREYFPSFSSSGMNMGSGTQLYSEMFAPPGPVVFSGIWVPPSESSNR
jgi:hypothetical protein